jgi:branched-chain amino acid transport system ATP-binding protein
VEQNALLSLQIANRGYVMESGTVVLADEAERLLKDPKVREAYLGESA